MYIEVVPVGSRWQGLRNTARKLGLRRGLDIIQKKQPFHSEVIALGLRRDLTIPLAAPVAKIPITIRQLAPHDYPILFNMTTPEIDAIERELRKSRQELAEAGIGRGYVAVTEDDQPCYVQWLFESAENEVIHSWFEGLFPPLRKGETLLEGAFTPAEHRGKGIMSAAMAQIAEQASELDSRFVVTFVTEDNVPSLKGCSRAGFIPYVRRSDKWRGIRRSITFAPTASQSGNEVGG